MGVLDINGKPYTSATQDMRLEELTKKFREVLGQTLTEAMQKSKTGRVEIHIEPLESVIAAAYYMGREDAS